MMRACVCVCVCVCLIIFHMCDTTCSVYDVLKKRVLSMMCLKNKQVPCVICLRKRFCPFLLPQRNDCNTLQHTAPHRSILLSHPFLHSHSLQHEHEQASNQASFCARMQKKSGKAKQGSVLQCVAVPIVCSLAS